MKYEYIPNGVIVVSTQLLSPPLWREIKEEPVKPTRKKAVKKNDKLCDNK